MDIEKQKEESAFIESKQNQLLMKYIRQQRKMFDFAETMHWLALEKKEEDCLILCDTFTKWITAIKEGDSRKEELIELLKTVWRLQSYCVNIETMIQSSVEKYKTNENRNKELAYEKKKLELEFAQKEKIYQSKIELLGKEIKHYENSGIR